MTGNNSTSTQTKGRNQFVLQTIRNLKVGESHSWSLTGSNSIRSSAYQVALQLDRKFKTFTDVEKGEIVVTRLT